MSWIPATLIFVAISLAGAFLLCVWLIRRRRDANDHDRDSLA